VQETKSIVTQTSPDNARNLEEEPLEQELNLKEALDATSDSMQSDVFRHDTELAKWVHDTDALIAERRKTNLQVSKCLS
jgi:hypothetical protein